MQRPIVVIKLGGTAAGQNEAIQSLAAELAGYDANVILVHGGGKEVSALSERLGHTPLFENGVRMTSEAEMDVVEMVLSGLANKRLVRLLLAAGLPAVGISGADGGLVTGTPVPDALGKPSRTGSVAGVRFALLGSLLAAGYLPVVAPPASSSEFTALNINADDVAFAIAEAANASCMLFLSDVPGVMVDGAVVSTLTPSECKTHINSGAISGGMIPKINNALTAVAEGVNRVVIGNYEGHENTKGELVELIVGNKGTVITADPAGGNHE
ncbi:MAG: acetylglutamate kinase [Spirochaetales bacterium]